VLRSNSLGDLWQLWGEHDVRQVYGKRSDPTGTIHLVTKVFQVTVGIAREKSS